MPFGMDIESLPNKDRQITQITRYTPASDIGSHDQAGDTESDTTDRVFEYGYSRSRQPSILQTELGSVYSQSTVSVHTQSEIGLADQLNNGQNAEATETVPTRADILRSTRLRHSIVAATCLLYLLSTALNITVQLGSTRRAPAFSNIYLFQLDLSSLIPSTKDKTSLINSTARSIGLHDFYRVGLWSFCKGYFDTGVASCARPRIFFWFNPQQVFLDELLQSSKIILPSTAVAMLKALRITSKVMFGTLFVGAILDCILLLATPIVLFSRWWSLPVSIIAAMSTLSNFMGASIATGISVAIKVGLSFQKEVNIGNRIGVTAIVFMWVSAGISLAALLLQSFMGYRVASSIRDVKIGRAPLIHEKTPDDRDSDTKFRATRRWMGLLCCREEGSTTEKSTLGNTLGTALSTTWKCINDALHRLCHIFQ